MDAEKGLGSYLKLLSHINKITMYIIPLFRKLPDHLVVFMPFLSIIVVYLWEISFESILLQRTAKSIDPNGGKQANLTDERTLVLKIMNLVPSTHKTHHDIDAKALRINAFPNTYIHPYCSHEFHKSRYFKIKVTLARKFP